MSHKIIIDTDGSIFARGPSGVAEYTGLRVRQESDRTALYRAPLVGPVGEEIPLPAVRYSLAHPRPMSGTHGREDFAKAVKDILALTA